MRNSNRMQQHALIRVAIGRKVEVIVPHVLNRTAFLQVLFPTTTILAAKSFTMADTGVCSSTRSCGCSTVRGSIFVCTLSSTFILLNAIGAPHLFCNDSACTLSFFDFLFSNKHLLTFVLGNSRPTIVLCSNLWEKCHDKFPKNTCCIIFFFPPRYKFPCEQKAVYQRNAEQLK